MNLISNVFLSFSLGMALVISFYNPRGGGDPFFINICQLVPLEVNVYCLWKVGEETNSMMLKNREVQC